jgi:2-C-methyl-D-erythritol 4-phosphate cytidylyltransferase
MNKNIAIIFAGGSGARMGSGIPKQFIEISGKPIIIHTLEIFNDHPEIDGIYVSCKGEYTQKLEKLASRYMIEKLEKVVDGGDTALGSAYNALRVAKVDYPNDAIALIHDGVRPYITNKLISDNIESVKRTGSAITCTPMFETPVISIDGEFVDDVLNRDTFYTAQAPQSFYLGDILRAHEETRPTNPNYDGIVDACALVRSTGKKVSLIKGNRGNIKITTPEDLYLFRGLIQYQESSQAYGLSESDIPDVLKK